MRVVEAPRHVDLVLEALHGLPVEDSLCQHHLHRHGSAQVLLLGPEHDPAAAGAKLALDAVSPTHQVTGLGQWSLLNRGHLTLLLNSGKTLTIWGQPRSAWAFTSWFCDNDADQPMRFRRKFHQRVQESFHG